MADHASVVSRIRATKGYDKVIRDLGCIWFFLLAAMVAWEACARLQGIHAPDLTFPDMANLIVSTSIISLYLSVSWLILHRPPHIARTDGILPSVTALIGTYLPWSLMLFAADPDPRGPNSLSLAFQVIGTAGAVMTICYLGKSFSIVPHARRLVRDGPYSIVRHPLYLAEEVAVLGCLLRFLCPATVAFFLAHCALQIARISFEENLLRRSIPDYDDYARSTSRLIPYVW